MNLLDTDLRVWRWRKPPEIAVARNIASEKRNPRFFREERNERVTRKPYFRRRQRGKEKPVSDRRVA